MEKKNEDTRIESDLIGLLEVPKDVLYGIQTTRAINLYPTNGERKISDYPELIKGMLRVKKIAAKTNLFTGELDPSLANAIISVTDKLINNIPSDQFPIHCHHGGGGISTNMNINEVISNLANKEYFESPLGTYFPIHPNDHINLNNSTSDSHTTACHFAIIEEWKKLSGKIKSLSIAFELQSNKWKEIKKISRTCLQDAVEISFADMFSAYKALIDRNFIRIDEEINSLYLINLGGNIIGRKGDCSPEFFERVIDEVNSEFSTLNFKHNVNLFDASQNHDDLVAIANRLDLFSRALIKIAKDFRLMASGPETGLGELKLPEVQPGSSAMPGKINPTIPEYLVQSCMQVCGHCYSAQMTQDHGELDLNVWQSVLINNILDAIRCLYNGINSFTTHCVLGIEPNIERNKKNINTIIPTLIKIKQKHGYSFASKVYKDSGGNIKKIRKILND